MSQGLVARIAHWTSTHRRFTVLAWLSALVVALAVSGAAGSHYSNNNSLKGTESQRATDLLARSFPSQAGDADQIVLHVRQGRVTDPAVRARVNPVLSRVAPGLKVREAGFVRNIHEPTMFAVRDLLKDLDLGLALYQRAPGARSKVPLTAITRELFAAVASRVPDLDISAIGTAYSTDPLPRQPVEELAL